MSKFTIYLVPDDFGLVGGKDWVHFVAHTLAPEENAVDLTLADPALVLVVRLTSYSILGAFVPLAAPGDVFLVAEHPLEHKLVVHRVLNRVVFVDLAKFSVTLHLHLETIYDIA